MSTRTDTMSFESLAGGTFQRCGCVWTKGMCPLIVVHCGVGNNMSECLSELIDERLFGVCMINYCTVSGRSLMHLINRPHL